MSSTSPKTPGPSREKAGLIRRGVGLAGLSSTATTLCPAVEERSPIVPPALVRATTAAGGTQKAQSPHGTRNRYLHGPDEHDGPGGCRCTPCRKANAAAANRRRLAIDAGIHVPMVDAEPVRQHLLELKAAGLSYQRVAQIAGVSRHTVNCLLYGKSGTPPTKRMDPARAAALLAVRATDMPPQGWVPAVGTRRRIQALAAIGWPGRVVGKRLGLSQHAVTSITSGRTARVSVETATLMRTVYDDLWNVDPGAHGVSIGSSSLTRRHAAVNGWRPPLAWDDDEIDRLDADGADLKPPSCAACGAEGELRQGYCVADYHRWRRAGKPKDGPPPRSEELQEDFLWLLQQGVSTQDAARRVGVSLRTARPWVPIPSGGAA